MKCLPHAGQAQTKACGLQQETQLWSLKVDREGEGVPAGWCSQLPLNQEVLPIVVGRLLEASWAPPGLPRFTARSELHAWQRTGWQETPVYSYERWGQNQADPSGGGARTLWDLWTSGGSLCPIQASPGPDLPWAAIGRLGPFITKAHP